MEDNCLNCNHPITKNFCINCGQKKYKRIDRKYLIDEIQYSVLHTNKGFFYSVKKLIVNPGKTARDFIEGNRVNHYKPILLAFVLSTISAFLSFKVLNFNEKMHGLYDQKEIPESFARDLIALISSYNSVMMLLFIPIVSLFTVVAFRKWGQNYYEHVVMNAFIQSCYTIFTILLVYPLLYFFGDSPSSFNILTQVSMLILPVILLWFYKDFYKEKPFLEIVLRLLLLFIFGIVLFILLIIIGIVVVVVFKPEMFMQFKPK